MFASVIWVAASTASNARAWPMSMSPAISMVCTGCARFSRRSRLDTALRERPTRLRRLLMREVEFGNQALYALRLFQRVEVFALDVFNQRHRGGGLVVDFLDQHRHLSSPASCAARKRRSPAMISYCRPLCAATGRTSIGCSKPCALIESASSSSAPSSMRVRGWYLPGCNCVIGSDDGVAGERASRIAVVQSRPAMHRGRVPGPCFCVTI